MRLLLCIPINLFSITSTVLALAIQPDTAVPSVTHTGAQLSTEDIAFCSPSRSRSIQARGTDDILEQAFMDAVYWTRTRLGLSVNTEYQNACNRMLELLLEMAEKFQFNDIDAEKIAVSTNIYLRRLQENWPKNIKASEYKVRTFLAAAYVIAYKMRHDQWEQYGVGVWTEVTQIEMDALEEAERELRNILKHETDISEEEYYRVGAQFGVKQPSTQPNPAK